MTRLRIVPLIVAGGLLVLSGCGDSDSDESGDGATTTVADDSAGSSDDTTSTDDTDSGSGDSGSSGNGTGTATLADGTVLEFEMVSCDTNDNDDGYTVDPGYDLSGNAEDGTYIQLLRAGFDDDSVVANGSLEGEFGTGIEITYSAPADANMNLAVDGDSVTGTVSMNVIGNEAPLGESIEAEIDIAC